MICEHCGNDVRIAAWPDQSLTIRNETTLTEMVIEVEAGVVSAVVISKEMGRKVHENIGPLTMLALIGGVVDGDL